MIIQKAYKIRLYPTNMQKTMLARTVECCWGLHNQMLENWKTIYDQLSSEQFFENAELRSYNEEFEYNLINWNRLEEAFFAGYTYKTIYDKWKLLKKGFFSEEEFISAFIASHATVFKNPKFSKAFLQVQPNKVEIELTSEFYKHIKGNFERYHFANEIIYDFVSIYFNDRDPAPYLARFCLYVDPKDGFQAPKIEIIFPDEKFDIGKEINDFGKTLEEYLMDHTKTFEEFEKYYSLRKQYYFIFTHQRKEACKREL